MSNTSITLPSSGFSREGYILAGWSINGVKYPLGASYDLVKDATAYAMWEDDPNYTYESAKEYSQVQNAKADQIYIAATDDGGTQLNNLKNSQNIYFSKEMLGLGANTYDINTDCVKKSLVSAYISNRVQDLHEKCFQGCEKLEEIYIGTNISSIGDNAFRNCTNLTSVSILDDGSSAKLTYVGKYAFSNTDLRKVQLYLKPSVSDSSTNSYCFAHCSSLTDFRFTGAPYLADHMFYNCVRLTSITLKNSHNYVNPYCFANCISLQYMYLPDNVYMLADHMFDGCQNLATVQFGENSILKQIGDEVFNGCYSLTSIVLPESVADLTCLGDTFLKGSSIEQITFKGLDGSAFSQRSGQIESSINKFGSDLESITYIDKDGGEWICINGEITKHCKYVVDTTTTSDFRYGIWYGNAEELKAFVDQYHIPCLIERSSVGCDPCIDFKRNTWRNDVFQDAILNRKFMFCRVEAEGSDSFNTPNTIPYFVSHNWCKADTYIPEITLYWKKDDSYTLEQSRLMDWNYNYRTDYPNANYQTVLNRLDSTFADYVPETQFEHPAITIASDRSYKYYANESGDDNGRYFVFDKKTQRESITDISIKIGSTTITSLTVGGSVSLSNGTYMAYTPEDDSTFTDQYAVLFKVESGKVSYLYSCENEEEYTETLDPSEDRYPLGCKYDMDINTTYDSFNDFLMFEAKHGERRCVFLKLDSGSASTAFENNIINNAQFKQWYESSNYAVVKIKSDQWTRNAPLAMAEFEERSEFDTTITTLPKIFMFRGCYECVDHSEDDPYRLDVWVNEVIGYDSSKNVLWYTDQIDSVFKNEDHNDE